MRKAVVAAAFALLTALPATSFAQEPTLADLRVQLDALRGDFQQLRAELVASGAAGYQAAGGDAAIDRMNAMEQQLARLTDRTEQLQNRINRIVSVGGERLDELEFRLCEMDETCDLSQLTGTNLNGDGGGDVTVLPSTPTAPGNGTAATAQEQADFDAASEVLSSGDFARAAEMFDQVAKTHAGGPLTGEALYLRGMALERTGNTRAAAASWLEGFSADPDGPRAGESLLNIAEVIENDGDPTAACLYLAEVPARFPGTPMAETAETRMSRLLCGSNDLTAPAHAAPLDPAAMDPEAAADLAEHH
ncbi:tetratricopeptide repeat protein [Paracoccus caeni]|uniref:Cell division coordinator CpoB n=1 Tax=Paracoccus caeni TaxID=657651 RepID=A0A934SBQ6_9RHOB|nr:tetratricopeptide repeat protein [Paracoccus caeni]MBK4214793.1 tetratricopeptide repeat protein [Paracoccus caeni]